MVTVEPDGLAIASVAGREDDPPPPDLIREVAAVVEDTAVTAVLFDLRARRTVPTGNEARSLARLIASFPRLRRCAIAVVATRPALYGMARLLGTVGQSEGVRLEAFGDMDSARAWLDGEGRGKLH